MNENIKEISCGAFAKVIETKNSINGLKDGVLYVKNSDCERIEEYLNAANEFLNNGNHNVSCVMEYKVELMPENCIIPEDIKKQIRETDNALMPIFTSYCDKKYYLTVKTDELKYVGHIVYRLIYDAERITMSSFPYILQHFNEDEAERLADAVVGFKFHWKVNRMRIGHQWTIGVMCLCDSVVPNPMAFLSKAAEDAYRAVKKGLLSYEDRQKLKCNIRQICSMMNSKDKKKRIEGEKEFAKVVAAMSEKEKIQFMKECVNIIGNSKHIDEAANKVLNRDEMGRKSECKIFISDDITKRKVFKIGDNHKLFIFIEKNGKQYPVKMSPVSTVIYVMNLICRQKDVDNKYVIVDIYKNQKTFEDVYLTMLNDKRRDEIANRLDTILMEGRLKEYYNEIENKMAEIFREVGEDYSPFLVNYDTVLS